MNQLDAEKIIESLREGIPPDGKVSLLTVGRIEEINRLRQILHKGGPKALLIKADYGCGKTHLLKFIKEEALNLGYVASLITLDSKSNARFNRMDQIFGQVCRNIQVPGINQKSVRYLFDALFNPKNKLKLSSEKAEKLMFKISNGGKWNYSNFLRSPSMFIAVRAWKFSYDNNHKNPPGIDDAIEDWLFNPYNYYSQRKYLYYKFVANLRNYFLDPRPEWKFYDPREGIFNFQIKGYEQSWDALYDLNTLAEAAGYKGLVILVDEFEDVIYNLRNIKYQQDAFWNLSQFFSGERFPGLAFFAVTPNFVEKCKKLLQEKNIWDYDYSTFDRLEKFQMSPLSTNELLELSEKIIKIHEIAYSWNINEKIKEKIRKICINSSRIPVGDRVRQTIKNIVKELDSYLRVN